MPTTHLRQHVFSGAASPPAIDASEEGSEAGGDARPTTKFDLA